MMKRQCGITAIVHENRHNLRPVEEQIEEFDRIHLHLYTDGGLPGWVLQHRTQADRVTVLMLALLKTTEDILELNRQRHGRKRVKRIKREKENHQLG